MLFSDGLDFTRGFVALFSDVWHGAVLPALDLPVDTLLWVDAIQFIFGVA